MAKIKVNGKEYTKKQFDECIVRDMFSWLQEHPVLTNKDLLEKIFGDDVFDYIESTICQEDWMVEEYRYPKKGE